MSNPSNMEKKKKKKELKNDRPVTWGTIFNEMGQESQDFGLKSAILEEFSQRGRGKFPLSPKAR
jgi:hypothetical protein